MAKAINDEEPFFACHFGVVGSLLRMCVAELIQIRLPYLQKLRGRMSYLSRLNSTYLQKL